jgi:hypothetical protein
MAAVKLEWTELSYLYLGLIGLIYYFCLLKKTVYL